LNALQNLSELWENKHRFGDHPGSGRYASRLTYPGCFEEINQTHKFRS